MLDKMPAIFVSGLLVLSRSEEPGENHLGKTAGEGPLRASTSSLYKSQMQERTIDETQTPFNE